jgi:hypothetical protein
MVQVLKKQEAANTPMARPMATPMEVNAADLTPELFAACMRDHGCVVLRNLFTAKEGETLAREVFDLFYVVDNLAHNGLMTENGIKYLQGGHPANLVPNMRLLQNLLNKPTFIQALQAHFSAGELEVNVESTGVRRCDPLGWKNFLPWHQDLLHRKETFVTVWVPLCDVGHDAPGLELVPTALREKQHHDSGIDVTYGKGMDDEQVNQSVSTARLQPVLSLGDVLVFSPYTLHRTYQTPDMTRQRVSLDVRVHPSGANPEAETWKTQVLTFPASEAVVPKFDKDGRAFFDLQHLVASAGSVQASEPAAALPELKESPAKRLVRKFFGV